MISLKPEGELNGMQIGEIRSCSSSSISSFDSCSDLLGLMDMHAHSSAQMKESRKEYEMDVSAHSLTQTKEGHQDYDTNFGRFPTDKGDDGAADAKHLKVLQADCRRFVKDQNGCSVEGLIKQADSLQAKTFEGEEAKLSGEPYTLEQQAAGLSGPMRKAMGSFASKKGGQISSLSWSPPSSLEVASASMVLPKGDAVLQDGESYAIDCKVLNSPQQTDSLGKERGVNDCKFKAQLHLESVDLAVNSETDNVDAKSIDREEPAFNDANQSHNQNLNVGIRVTSDPSLDNDLRQLENSIKFFDLYKTNNALRHPLRSMSTPSSSLDFTNLEQTDSSEVVCKHQSLARSLSSGRIRKDKFASTLNKRLKSASMHSWIDDGESQSVPEHSITGKDNFQYKDKRELSTVVCYDNLGIESVSLTVDQEGATMAQMLGIKQRNGEPMLKEKLFGKTQEERWKISSPEGKSRDLTTFECNDLGPDELFRYVESLYVDEKYMDVQMDIKNRHKSKAGSLHGANHSDLGSSCPILDDSMSSSTSESHKLSSHSIHSAKELPFVVDSVQVVGARQRRGGSSLWERMVGVKDHTVYCIKVVSGKHEWEVLRRYRDFMNFYQQLKRIFNGRSGSSLISASYEVETDSKKVFGNTSPSVVQARTILIEKFLQSLLQAGPPFSTASPFFWFLHPPQGAFEGTGFEEHLTVQSSVSQRSVDVQLGNLDHPQSHFFSNSESSKREQMEDRCPVTMGKTIKLVLVIHQNKSLKQVLYAQHHSCAACYKHLDYENGLIQGFAQAFGRGRPRFCEYTGQLFCSSCHLNEFSVLPAYVLWHWDFTPRRVSQLAKSYLDSTYDQPLLCVSKVNPYLYQRVHYLRNVNETRAKLSRVLSCMRCPAHARILQILGSRRYLLENNDFFALRDLEDLSKGAFAVLPGLLTAVLRNMVMHVTKQCSVCQDSGEWCGAGILCEDPFRPIFPFNEDDSVLNCEMCNAPFHRKCYAKCSSCPACPQDWVDTKHEASSVRDKK